MTELSARYLPWIPVTTDTGRTVVGLETLLLDAHTIRDLNVGGLERAALLRFLPQVVALVGRKFASTAKELATCGQLPPASVLAALDDIDDVLEPSHADTPFLQDARIRQVLAVRPTDPKPPRDLLWHVPNATMKGWFGRREEDTDVTLSAAEATMALVVEWFYGKSGNDRIDGFWNTAGTIGLFGGENQFFFRGRNLLRTILANMPERWLTDDTEPTWVSRAVGSQPANTLAEASTTCGAALFDFEDGRAVGMYRLGALPPLEDYVVWKQQLDIDRLVTDRDLDKKTRTALVTRLTDLIAEQDAAVAAVEKTDGEAAARAFNATLTTRTGPEGLRPDTDADQAIVTAAREAKANLAVLYATSKELRAATIANARKSDHHRVYVVRDPKKDPVSVRTIRPEASAHQHLIRWFADADIPKTLTPDSALVSAGDAADVTVSVLCIDATKGKAPSLDGVAWLDIPDSGLLFDVDALRAEILTALASDLKATVTDKVTYLTDQLWPGTHNRFLRAAYTDRILSRFYATADPTIGDLVTKVYTAERDGEDATALLGSVRPTWYQLRDAAAIAELEPLMTRPFTEKAIVALARARMSGPQHDPARALPPELVDLTHKVVRGRSDPAFRTFVAADLAPRDTAPQTTGIDDEWRATRRVSVPVRRALALAAAHPRLPLDEDYSLGDALASVSHGDDAVAERVRGLIAVDDIDRVTSILHTLLSRLDSRRSGLNWFDVTYLLSRWNSADAGRVRRQLLFDFYRRAAE